MNGIELIHHSQHTPVLGPGDVTPPVLDLPLESDTNDRSTIIACRHSARKQSYKYRSNPTHERYFFVYVGPRALWRLSPSDYAAWAPPPTETACHSNLTSLIGTFFSRSSTHACVHNSADLCCLLAVNLACTMPKQATTRANIGKRCVVLHQQQHATRSLSAREKKSNVGILGVGRWWSR